MVNAVHVQCLHGKPEIPSKDAGVMSERSRSVAASTAAHVTRSGRVHLDGVRVAIGAVHRELNRAQGDGWASYAYGQPAKTSFHKLRRDAVAWVVREWESLKAELESLGKVSRQ
jgi:hypothetical protein